MPHESNCCGRETNVLVAFGNLPKCNEDIAATPLARYRIDESVQPLYELRIPTSEIKSLLESEPPATYNEPHVRLEWARALYERSPGIIEPIYRFYMSYPEEARRQSEIHHEHVLCALCNAAKLIGVVNDGSKAVLFVPCTTAGRGIGVMEFGLSRDVTEREQLILELIANEVVVTIWAIDKRIHENEEERARAKLAYAQAECHEIRHLFEEQQLALGTLSVGGEQQEEIDAITELSRRLGDRLEQFQRQLRSNNTAEPIGLTDMLHIIKSPIPGALVKQLQVVHSWPKELKILIPGSAAELATALAPLVHNALIYGDRERKSNPDSVARLHSWTNEMMAENQGPWNVEMLTGDPAAAIVVCVREGNDKQSSDDITLDIVIFDCAGGPPGETLVRFNFTPYGERVSSEKPTGGRGLLTSIEFLINYYHAMVTKMGPDCGLTVRIICRRVRRETSREEMG